MIKLKGLNKYYQTKKGQMHALKDINLDVAPGEIIGIVGESGAGKSTLVRCMNLLEYPSSGEIFVGPEELTQLSPNALRKARRHIGKIFQHFNLLSSRTVYGNIGFPLELVGKTKEEMAKRIDPLLELTGLSSQRDYYPSQLSGGQKQRVAIARALASRPKVLLCDEATSALDPKTTRSILDLLNDINKKLGLTIVIITHEMDVVKHICHRVAVLDHGELIEQNELFEFLSNPKTELGKQFVHSCLRMELPDRVKKELKTSREDGASTIISLQFKGQQIVAPIISHLIQKFHLEVNILQANIEFVRHESIGIMLIAVSGQDKHLEQALTVLEKEHVQAEVIGYV